MPVYRLNLEHSSVQHIAIFASSYSEGKIIIGFDSIKSAQIIVRNIHLSTTTLGNSYYEYTDISNTRSLIEKLIGLKAIKENDYPSVFELVKKIEQHLTERNAIKISTPTSISQESILLTVAEIYIDDILESTNNHTDTGLLLRACFSKLTTPLKPTFTQYLEKNKIDPTVWGSVEGLLRICTGEANLETTYLRMNQSVPTLLQQRNIIFRNCIKKLLEKYIALDEESKIFMIMELEMFRMESSFSPLEINRNILTFCLSNEKSHPVNRKYFSQSVISPMVSLAFNFLEINKPIEKLVEKIKYYQIKFNSPALKEWLDSIEENNKKERQQVESKILQGLKAKNSDLIKEGIKDKEDINQYTNDAITFLIHAVIHCPADIVELLVENGALVNKPGQYGQTSAIGEAVKLTRIKVAKILFKAGADVNATIRERDDSVPEYKRTGNAIYIKETPLFIYALRHLDCRNPLNDINNLNMVSTLIYFGAGVGSNFPILIDVFDKHVFIGACTYISEPAILIKTAKQFIQHISSKDYEHWKMVFNRFLHNNTFITRPNIELELKTIVVHINNFTARASEESIAKSRQETLRKIVAHYKLPNAGIPALQTALRRAAALDDVDTISFLSTQHIDINAQDDNPNNKKTALHWAVKNEQIRAIKLLRSLNARIDIEDAIKKTVTDYVHESNNGEMKILFNLANAFSRLRLS